MGRRKTNRVHEYVEYDYVGGTSKCLVEGCAAVIKGNHSSNMLRHFAAHHNEVYEEIMEKNKLSRSIDDDCSPAPPLQIKSKRIRLDNFAILKQCCIDLVKIHGRPIALFDDDAFKEMVALIPLATKERLRINSKSIAKYIKEDEEQEPLRRDKSTENGVEKNYIKYEVLCTCSTTLDEERETPLKHDSECPMAANQPYWNYFEVSVDVATCTLCKENLNWTNISELKEHLKTQHAGALFKDDDENFEDGGSSASSTTSEVNEQIYVEENLLTNNILGKPTRKTITTSPTKTSDDQPLVPKEISNDWAQGLDRFGLYVSSLMKFLPKQKCIRFQSQIVQRLLQEQTSAA